MTDDERFEQFLRDTAADYELPASEIPRDPMWDAIRARRAASTPTLGAPAFASQVPHLAHRRTMRWAWIGMAATLLLGVAVGRYAWRHEAAPSVAGLPQLATPQTPAPQLVSPTSSVSAAPVAPATSLARPDNGSTLASARTTTYSLVAARHLANVEALLTSYAVSGVETRSDSMFGAWAKDLLSNTRLLMDSPAARDPVRARLLSDLEVILVQLVQRSPGHDAEERSAVERTLQKTQLIPRLRSAVPASARTGTD